MRYLVIIAVLTSVVATTLSKPAEYIKTGDGAQEETDYEGEGDEKAGSNEDALREEGDSNVDKKEPSYDQEDEDAILKTMNTEGKRVAPASNDNPSSSDKSDTSPDYKLNADRESENMKPNDAFQPNMQHRCNRYTEDKEADEQTDMAQNSANIDVNTSNRELFLRQTANSKRSSKTTADDNGEEIFENAVVKERSHMPNDPPSNIGSAIEANHDGFFKHYYKTLLQGVDEKARLDDRNYENCPSNFFRNRRQTRNLGSSDTSEQLTSKDDSKNTIHGKEEIEIKRHIEKLSDLELEELLKSLPEEKRLLLNKIIDSEKCHSNNLSKRDITKKAGAVEENIDIDNGVFDSSKIQGGVSSVDTKNEAVHSIDTTENAKPSDDQTETSEASISKKTDSHELSYGKGVVNVDENKSDIHQNDISINGDGKSKDNLESNERPKNNKREADLNELDNKNEDPSFSDTTFLNADFNPSNLNDNSNEEIGFNFQDDDLSQLICTEELLENNNVDHVHKRETCLENTDSFKSLEESFPNSNTYKESGQYSEMDMVPLVRVKRRNEGSLVKKRSAGLEPDDKVAYFPYRSENDDDDTEEGNEFEDEGFYDRTFSYAKENENSQPVGDSQSKKEEVDENLESDTMNIGSDTDSVLSGVEGVDENLMLSSGSRNRRKVENKPINEEDANRSALSDLAFKTQTDNRNVLNYQANDAFGPLPRNYEGELNRLKRIRRLKTQEDVSSSNTDVQTNTL